MLEEIINNYPDDDILLADGLDDAVIGIENNSMRLIYSVSKCIDIFISNGMNQEEAIEFFEYNTACAYVGEHTPIWCYDEF